jgi:hypothetical protein
VSCASPDLRETGEGNLTGRPGRVAPSRPLPAAPSAGSGIRQLGSPATDR